MRVTLISTHKHPYSVTNRLDMQATITIGMALRVPDKYTQIITNDRNVVVSA